MEGGATSTRPYLLSKKDPLAKRARSS